jgi:hypothetical protein
MILSHLNAQTARIALRATLASSTLVLVACALLAGCAPDSVRSAQATGFNAYLRQVGANCPTLLIGSDDVGIWLRVGGDGTNDYEYFLNVTSQLYYNRISPTEYRNSLNSFLGPGRSNETAFACIIGNLPADRPNAPK